MFTGIVQAQVKITEISDKTSFRSLKIKLPDSLRSDLAVGASISVDGVCLTVTSITEAIVSFDVMHETLRVTTLGELKSGDSVNIERSAHEGKEIGGHILSGHVDGTVKITAVEAADNNHVLTFKVPKQLMRYVFSKGFVALNGTSLTIVNADKKNDTFQVWFIPETLRVTTFGSKKVGDSVNIEVDRATQVIVDTVRAYLEEHYNEIIPDVQNG